MSHLYTTLGPKRADELGMILPHEHIFVDLRTWDQPGYGEADPEDVIARMGPEVEAARAAGVTAPVDCAPLGVGRRADILQRVSEATGFPIVAPTGVYREPWVTPWAHVVERGHLVWLDARRTGRRHRRFGRAARGFIKLSAGDDGLTAGGDQDPAAPRTRAAVATDARPSAATLSGAASSATNSTLSKGWAARRGASSGFTPRPSRILTCTWKWQGAAAGSNTTTSAGMRPRGFLRCDDKARTMQIHSGRSVDGVNWQLKNERIEFVQTGGEPYTFEYGYDPRVCWIEDRYYVTWCNAYEGWPTIGLGYTYDFETFYQMENIFIPYNRNGVLFPREIRGKYAILSRPSDRGHTPFGDIYYSESPDLIHWGCHRFVAGTTSGWQSTKMRGADAHRDDRRMALVLPWRADLMQRIRLQRRPRCCSTWMSRGR